MSEQTYSEVVRALRGGEPVPAAAVAAAIAAEGVEIEQFIRDVFGGARPGGRCPCGGRLRVRRSRAVGTFQRREVDCPRCGARAGVQVLPRDALRVR